MIKLSFISTLLDELLALLRDVRSANDRTPVSDGVGDSLTEDKHLYIGRALAFDR